MFEEGDGFGGGWIYDGFLNSFEEVLGYDDGEELFVGLDVVEGD